MMVDTKKSAIIFLKKGKRVLMCAKAREKGERRNKPYGAKRRKRAQKTGRASAQKRAAGEICGE